MLKRLPDWILIAIGIIAGIAALVGTLIAGSFFLFYATFGQPDGWWSTTFLGQLILSIIILFLPLLALGTVSFYVSRYLIRKKVQK